MALLSAEPLIGVFAAMVIVIAFRRKTPKVVEVAVWIGLVWACALAITGTHNLQVRALTSATAWGAGQIVSNFAGVLGQGASKWLYDARFAIAEVVVVLFAVDALALALVSSKRQANAQMPVTRLRDWMMLPRLQPAPLQGADLTPVDRINERFNRWGVGAAAATMRTSIVFSVWLRGVGIPGAARSLRDLGLGAGVAWRRVAAGRAQLGEVRISDRSVALTASSARLGNQTPDVVLEPAPRRQERVDPKRRPPSSGARKAQAGTTAHIPRKRSVRQRTQAGPKTGTNDSKKRHRQGRLAS